MIRRAISAISVVMFVLLLTGCSTVQPAAKINSVKSVESLVKDGVSYKYQDQDIIQIDLDFTFTDGAVSNLAKLDTSSDEYRKGLYALLAPGAHLFNEGQPVQRTYGYWPKQADRNSAKQLTLFYVVPRNRTTQSLRFVYDGAVLGEGGSGIDTTIQPS